MTSSGGFNLRKISSMCVTFIADIAKGYTGAVAAIFLYSFGYFQEKYRIYLTAPIPAPRKSVEGSLF